MSYLLVADTLAERIDTVATHCNGHLRYINGSDVIDDYIRYMFRGQFAFRAGDTLTGRFIADDSD
jgi:hypothetical protein